MKKNEIQPSEKFYQALPGGNVKSDADLMEFLRNRKKANGAKSEHRGKCTEAKKPSTRIVELRKKAVSFFGLPESAAQYIEGNTPQEIFMDAERIRNYRRYGIENVEIR